MVQMKPLFEGDPAPSKEEHDWIEDMVGALTDPIIVYPDTGWEDSLPEPVRKRLPIDRLIHLMRQQKGEIPYDVACDTEALLYLFPRSLAAPMGELWTDIYCYLFNQVMEGMNVDIPEDFKKHSELSAHKMNELIRLKMWIHRKKLEVRKARRKRAKAETSKEASPEQDMVPAENEQLGLGF